MSLSLYSLPIQSPNTLQEYDTAESPPGGYDNRDDQTASAQLSLLPGDRTLSNRLIQAEPVPGTNRYRLIVNYELPGEFDLSEVETILARTEKWRFSTEALGYLAAIVDQAIASVHAGRTAA